MNLIVAVDKNWAIGKVVVMGRKTLESFPNGLPLKTEPISC